MSPRAGLVLLLMIPALGAFGASAALETLDQQNPSYGVLADAAEKAGSDHWIIPRLKDGEPVPLASARELEGELLESDKLSASDKDALKQAFPSVSDSIRQWVPLDWIDATDPAYALLRDDAKKAGSSHWTLPLFERGDPVPQASARDLENELLQSDALDARDKADLRAALPSETAWAAKKAGQLDKMAWDPEARLDRVERRLDEIWDTYNKNLYNMGAFPQTDLDIYADVQSLSAHGIYARERLGHDLDFTADMTGQLAGGLGSFEINIGGGYDNQLGDNPFPSYYESALLNGLGLRINLPQSGINVSYGVRKYLNLSVLTYSSVGYPYQNAFYLPASSATVFYAQAPAGLFASDGLYIQQLGESLWWPFSETQIVASPLRQYYDANNTQRVDNLTARVDLRNLAWTSLLDNFSPYFTATFFNNDGAQQYAYQSSLIPDTVGNRAFTVGLNSQVAGGGSIQAEWAASQGVGQVPGVNGNPYHDQAAFVDAGKALGEFTLSTELSYVGPYFVVGQVQPFYSDNVQSGAMYDSSLADPRPSRQGDVTWQTIAREPAGMVNNTKRAVLKGEWQHGWMRFGLAAGTAPQVLPSGPWIQTSQYLDGDPNNGYVWYQIFGNEYASPPSTSANPGLLAFNAATPGTAYYKGAPMGVVWDQLAQETYQDTSRYITVTQNGIGDPNLRADSIKVLNHARATTVLDFKNFFGGLLSREIDVNAEVREVNETVGLAGMTPNALLNQSYVEAYPKFGLNKTVELVGMLAYETLDSRASYVPVEAFSRNVGLGLNFYLSPILSTLIVDLRVNDYRYYDAVFTGRSFDATVASVATTLTY